VACVVGSLTASTSRTTVQGRAIQAAGLLDRFFAPDPEPLVSYHALRTLTASTRGGKMQGTIVARTTLDVVNGFRYEIVSENGAAVIRTHVLRAALEAERKAVGSSDASSAALTAANYEFGMVAATSGDLARVDVKPRRKNVMLIDGALFLDSGSADLVRVEGELSARPSFWTRRVRIVREYARIQGIHVPVSMESTADVLVVGQSTFVMSYQYSDINGRPVQ